MTGPLQRRSAGVLLHPTSLPGPGYCGTFGAEARAFVDLIAEAGLSIWQVLPLGPTHEDGSPYLSFSAHAGNIDLIDLEWLVHKGWLTPAEAAAGEVDGAAKRAALSIAVAGFRRMLAEDPGSDEALHYRRFLDQSAYWLEDYVRFRAFRHAQGGRSWTEWPAGLRHHDAGAAAEAAATIADTLDEMRFRQFMVDRQWHELRAYAADRGVSLFGDMPMYVHQESADVWAHQSLFDLDADGHPLTVTGVPPDYFSAEGQLWGNPQYRWDRMQDTGFQWWLQRFQTAARQFDIVRIDHFRAMEAFWEIPASATSAREGHWVPAPGEALRHAVREQFPSLRLVAENLGTISPEVEALRKSFELPGMRILQFAFDGNPDNPYLPRHHDRLDVVYTGTHDNDTTLGWFQSLSPELQGTVYRTLGDPPEGMPWMLVNKAMESVANTVIIPWQDFLGLDGAHRMNTPGTRVGNWHWRYRHEQVPGDLAQRIRQRLADTGRLQTA